MTLAEWGALQERTSRVSSSTGASSRRGQRQGVLAVAIRDQRADQLRRQARHLGQRAGSPEALARGGDYLLWTDHDGSRVRKLRW